MAESEHGKPLAPASTHFRSDEEALPMQLKHSKRRRSYVKCCGCVTAIFLILVMVILILVFTVFDIKNPVVKMNKVTLQRLNLVGNGSPNATIVVNVTVKNPNAASFKVINGTTTIYYLNNEVGQAKPPAIKIKPRSTISMNVAVELIPSKIVAVPEFWNDSISGNLTMNSLTVIEGKIKVISIVKKHIMVRLNCTITYSVKSMAIQQQQCRHRISM